MNVVAFQGCGQLISRLDQAVARPSVNERVAATTEALCGLIRSGELRLSDRFRKPDPEHYARRLIHKSNDHGYIVVAMVWGVGQGTPLHDHAGFWGVVGVFEGQVDVVNYDLLEQNDNVFRFQAQEKVQAGVGAAGTVIPPFEYHTIHNALADQSSITIHVYEGDMTQCNIFDPRDDGRHQRRTRMLTYTD